MADIVRTIDTVRGPLLVTVQRIADRGTAADEGGHEWGEQDSLPF